MRPPPSSSLNQYLNIRNVATAALLLAIALFLIVARLDPAAKAQNQTTSAPTPARTKGPDSVPGELLVRFRPGTTVANTKTRLQLSMLSGGRSVRVEVNHFGGSDLVRGLMLARVSPENTLDALKALRSRADVLYAEPNFIRQLDAVPNDTFYASQWPLKNAPPFPQIGGGISAESAWDTTTGNQSVVVGVIDSGIDIDHRDLKDNIFVNTAEIPGNNIDDDNNGFIDDVNGWDFANHDRTVFDNANEDAHGTHVAGIIGARGNNGAGIAGINWNVQLMPLKAIGAQGGTDSGLVEAYNYAKMMRQRGVNLRVLNNSYGGQRFSQSLLDAIKELGNAGILFVAAAGNETLNNDFVKHFPASYDAPNVIAVAASTEQGFFASQFSNRGGQTVHLAAPGDNVLSTTPHGYTGDGLVAANTDPDGSTYSRFSGTSMASPHVAGAAALALAANPGITLEKLRAAVLFGVDESGVFFFSTITSGRLNASRTVQYALENDTTPPDVAPEFHINSQDGRSVLLFYRVAGDDGMTGRASLQEFLFTDSTTGEVFPLNSAQPENPGVSTSTTVLIPFRHTSGQLSLRFTDNVGNTSTATVNVTVPLDSVDPYTVNVSPASPLTDLNSGTAVGPKGDDITQFVSLPFPIPFFGQQVSGVYVSSNGALYFTNEINPSFGPFDFAVANEPNLKNLPMIAAMWADLRTDRNATDNVYMVRPDLDRVIFRWQGVTFGSETPVNFEVELRRDGTIQMRYGNGNADLKPVIVGISGGDPDAYLVSSHSSENSQLSLTNAQTVTFALRNPPPPPISDIAVKMTVTPEPVIAGQNLTYQLLLTNLGPNPADLPVLTVLLPGGTSFVSCATSFSATCTNTSGTVTGRLSILGLSVFDGGIPFTIVVKVDAAPGASLQANASVTSARPDPNPANNSATVTSNVVSQTFAGNTRAIAAGNTHTSSVRNDGTVWTWGIGSQGQLGDGTSGIGTRTLTPLQVQGLDGVDTVEDSNGFVLALKSNGTVWGWGNNFNAQLGDGTSFQVRTRPVQTLINNVKGIAAGSFYGAAVKTDGTVWVWGAPSGLVNSFDLNMTPVQLSGVSNVTAIASGAQHLLMLKTDKTVWAIGVNAMGQLGNGNSTNSTTPVQVAGLSNVSRIAAGEEFSLAVKEDGTVWAWGLNFNGQLGPNGGNMAFEPHPNAVQVTGLPAIANIAAGDNFCLALASDHTIWSWGNNGSFQLGQGNGSSQTPVPKQIPNFGDVTAVAGGNHHSVALKSDGSVWGWGLNLEGEVGDGTFNTVYAAPVRVSGLVTVNSPVINPGGGKFFNSVDVTITALTPGATIHYTTNGSDPTENDALIVSGSTLHITTDTSLRARAWKPGLFPSGTSFAGFESTAPNGPPIIYLAQNPPAPDLLAAFDAMLLTTDPFLIVNPANLLKNPNDPNTRVMIFVLTLELYVGETPAAVTINLTDANGIVHNLPAEDVRPIPKGLSFAQVTFRLPDNLPAGTCQVKLTAHNLNSNVGTIRITQ
ncbi:MAG TPA: S8 family serine peptidase [Pyrinomonadaceae bacterium]